MYAAAADTQKEVNGMGLVKWADSEGEQWKTKQRRVQRERGY